MGIADSKVICAINTRCRRADLQALPVRHRGRLSKGRRPLARETRPVEMNRSDATRQVLWNIEHVWVMYALLVPTTLSGGLRHLSPRAAVAARDMPTIASIIRWTRVGLVAKYALLQLRTWRRGVSRHVSRHVLLGICHSVHRHGRGDDRLRLRHPDHDAATSTLIFQSLFVDVFGVLAIVGILMAGVRRWIARPSLLVYTTEASALILVLILVILVTGLFGRRLAHRGHGRSLGGLVAVWQPGGRGLAVR